MTEAAIYRPPCMVVSNDLPDNIARAMVSYGAGLEVSTDLERCYIIWSRSLLTYSDNPEGGSNLLT